MPLNDPGVQLRTNLYKLYVLMMAGAFVGCNGVLDGSASTPLQGFAGYERLLG
jgi:hypothetical protein